MADLKECSAAAWNGVGERDPHHGSWWGRRTVAVLLAFACCVLV